MKKYLVIILLAVVLNVLLFVGIQALVVQKRIKLADVGEFQLANFIRQPEEQAPPPKSRRELPQKPQKAETAKTQNVVDSVSKSDLQVAASFDFNFSMGDIGAPKIFLDSDLTAIVRIPPTYPHRAMLRNIEGWVDLMYTVTESGTVINPVVMAAQPEGTFEQAAINAVERWKYQPVLQDGKPSNITVKTRIIFKLQDAAE